MTAKTEEQSSILSVSEATQMIKQRLKSLFPAICIQGEISNFKRHSSGHLYFSLKDQGAQISAVMFRGSTKSLAKMPKDGDQVMVKGEIDVYPARGSYQILVKEMQHVGLGELLLKLEQLKREIHSRGWFKPDHKKAVPQFPKRIGVITSPTGAVIQDILNVLRRRLSGFHLILNPVKVQGPGSEEEIASAIRQMNEHNIADVLIVGRGGGSIEDLWAFNEECVAAAIYESKIPIVCAVGHETDHSIAEYVADVRAPTPSAAAEIVSAGTVQQREVLTQWERQLQQSILQKVHANREKLMGFMRHPVFSDPYALLGPWVQRLDDLREDIDQSMQQDLKHKRLQLNAYQQQVTALSPLTKLQHFKQKLLHLDRAIQQGCQSILMQKRQKLENLVHTLDSIDPKNLLKKGYSILFSEKKGSVIVSTQQLQAEDKVSFLLADGEAKATINEVKAKSE